MRHLPPTLLDEKPEPDVDGPYLHLASSNGSTEIGACTIALPRGMPSDIRERSDSMEWFLLLSFLARKDGSIGQSNWFMEAIGSSNDSVEFMNGQIIVQNAQRRRTSPNRMYREPVRHLLT